MKVWWQRPRRIFARSLKPTCSRSHWILCATSASVRVHLSTYAPVLMCQRTHFLPKHATVFLQKSRWDSLDAECAAWRHADTEKLARYLSQEARPIEELKSLLKQYAGRSAIIALTCCINTHMPGCIYAWHIISHNDHPHHPTPPAFDRVSERAEHFPRSQGPSHGSSRC